MAGATGINFKCPLCGGTELKVDANNDNSMVSCGSCGSQFGRWGDVKANLGLDANAGRDPAAAEKPKFKGLNSSFKMGGR
jgi:hypothetical protein